MEKLWKRKHPVLMEMIKEVYTYENVGVTWFKKKKNKKKLMSTWVWDIQYLWDFTS